MAGALLWGYDSLPMKRIVMVEDRRLFAEGVRQLLSRTGKYRVVSQFETAEMALQRIPKLWPDLVLMDLSLPFMNGLEATRRLKLERPDLPVVILSMYGDRALLRLGIDLGINGFVLKSSGFNDLLLAMDAVLAGEHYFSPGLTEGLLGDS